MYKWKEHVHFEYYNDNNRIGNVMTSPWCANTQAELRQRSPQGNLLVCRTHTPKTFWIWNMLGVGLLTR